MPQLQRSDVREDGLSPAECELKDFTYLVAHDLGAEFRHVAEFSRLLAQENKGQGPYADLIAQSAERCQRMLRALMSYSAVQTNELRRRAWPGRSIVERAIAELGAEEGARAAHFEVDVTGQVFADARMLIMVVRLALSNALEAARDGKACHIAISGAVRGDGVWVLEIADNGEGLAAEYREKAFAMFWRLDPDTPGVGAGLATLRRIVRRHGGDAQFLDAPSGARLQISIPSQGARQ